jgi:NAD(P)H dehydrogenase (quinone)
MLMVTGVGGNLGGLVAGHLMRMVGPKGFVGGTRDPASPAAQQLAAQGVEVRRCDFDDPASLDAAFQGVSAALIISTYADNAVRPRQNLNAIEAAGRAGVGRLVYTSFLNASPDTLADHGKLVHWPTEQAMQASGMAWTILRHALYADIMLNDIEDTLSTGVLRRAGGTAPCAYIAREDLSLSAATVLANPGHENKIYEETMARTYTGADIAALMSEAFGKPIRYEAVPADAWPQYMSDHWGLPLELARSSMGTMRSIEAGQFDIVSNDYQAITGRPPRTMEQFLREAAASRAAR